jgi:hypothetical protein
LPISAKSTGDLQITFCFLAGTPNKRKDVFAKSRKIKRTSSSRESTSQAQTEAETSSYSFPSLQNYLFTNASELFS